MRLLTLNCHSWQEEDQDEKLRHLAETIKENSYDVIALQEVNQSIDEKVGYAFQRVKKDNYAYCLLMELKKLGVEDYSLVWDFSHYFQEFEEGLAILTKFPIEEVHTFYTSISHDPSNWKSRKIVGVTVSYKGKLYTFYSCHMGWWHDSEEPFKVQIDHLLKNIPSDRTVFLLGDFNNDAFIKGEGYDYLLSCGFLDTFHLAEMKDSGVTVEGEIGGWEGKKGIKGLI